MAASYLNGGLAFNAMNQESEARKSLEEAVSCFDELIAQLGRIDGYVSGLAESRLQLGLLFESEGEPARAKEEFGKVRSLLVSLVQVDPLPVRTACTLSMVRITLRGSRLIRALCRRSAGRWRCSWSRWEHSVCG